MQIPILNGIYTDNGPDLRTSYPVNMVPVPKQSGISNGFLRPGDGIVANGSGPGVDRGFIRAGTIGNTKKRLAWFQQGNMRNWRIQRFRGDSDSHIAFARLEAQIEGLAY